MSLQVYQVLHVLSGFLLTAVTFQAFAAPTPERRRPALITGGVLSLLMLVGGFGAMARLGLEFSGNGWIHVKIACWLVLSALAGVAFRKPGATRALSIVAVVVVGTALYAVYFMRTAS